MTLVRPEMPGLFRTAFRLTGSRPDAEDLVQETCLVANQCLDELESCRSPGRWLQRVLYNRFVDETRKRRRSPIVPLNDSAESSWLASRAPGPEALAEQVDDEAAFTRAWHELDETQRALLSLRAEGFGLAEIEDITGFGREILAPRLHRARLKLKRHLQAQDHDAGRSPRFGSKP